MGRVNIRYFQPNQVFAYEVTGCVRAVCRRWCQPTCCPSRNGEAMSGRFGMPCIARHPAQTAGRSAAGPSMGSLTQAPTTGADLPWKRSGGPHDRDQNGWREMMPQPQILIAIDPAELTALREEIARLARKIEGATVKPRDEWEPLPQHAARIGVQTQTVRKWIREGKIDSRRNGGVTYVRSNPAG